MSIATVINEIVPLVVAPHSILITRSTLQISLECLRNIQHFDDMFNAERLLLVNSESLCRTHCIFDLIAPMSARSFKIKAE